MELKEFISETIAAIADATSELQSKYADEQILINPPSAQSGSDVYLSGSRNYTMRRVQNISFDVAVTAATSKELGGKAGIRVLSLELGGDGTSAYSGEQVSRVSFAVPITLKPTEEEMKNIEQGKKEDKEADERWNAAKASGRRKGIA
ncbi:hypothetical protein [Yoonia sp. BS5-3]|uniref:HK97 gp10 family phage protein n=1 Tax=Yoonia phaeophyticola TaxID=3137369 RepID=A0ABZ2V6S7_9RHOB